MGSEINPIYGFQSLGPRQNGVYKVPRPYCKLPSLAQVLTKGVRHDATSDYT